MKQSIFIFSLAIVSIFATSCDRVENPVIDNTTTIDWSLYPNADTSTYPWPTWTPNTNTVRKVLLEDYTGHTCTNCPSAATEAKNIEDANPGNVHVLSVHASTSSGFQVPSLPSLPLDHRTPAGDEYANVMDISFNPAGTVNRVEDANNNFFIFSSDWANRTTAELAKTPDFNLQTQYNYYESTNGLFLHVETEALNSLTGDYNLILFLVREKVIAPQKDQGGVTIYDYEHHNVLSDNINGIWGTPIVTAGINSGEKLYNDYSFSLPDPVSDTTYKADNLSIFTVVTDRNSYEVLQVERTNIEP